MADPRFDIDYKAGGTPAQQMMVSRMRVTSMEETKHQKV